MDTIISIISALFSLLGVILVLIFNENVKKTTGKLLFLKRIKSHRKELEKISLEINILLNEDLSQSEDEIDNIIISSYSEIKNMDKKSIPQDVKGNVKALKKILKNLLKNDKKTKNQIREFHKTLKLLIKDIDSYIKDIKEVPTV